MVDGQCESCDELSGTNRSLTVVIVGLVLLAVFVLAYKRSDRVRSIISKLNTRSMITKLKHMFVFFQGVLLIADVYRYINLIHYTNMLFLTSDT